MRGRRGRGRGRSLNRDFRTKRDDAFRSESTWLDDAQLQNERFEAYYKKQGIVPEEEWDAFMKAARTELPVVFRINGRGPSAEALRLKLQTDFIAKLANAGHEVHTELKTSSQRRRVLQGGEEGVTVAPPEPLPWYPDQLAWQLELSRRELRRIPAFETLHEYIKQETAIGNISRQEAVSMIPPLVLDVQPHHRVLDMCAAPGSKTVQLLEMLHSHQTEMPSGFVLANDVDFQRCNMMTFQVKRMVSPSVAVTSADASLFPNGIKVAQDRRPLVEFDRILADVPCSGDGTTRKNPEVWRKWKLHDACGLHPLQLRIALRGAKLLTVGGLMVYSTCSLNPIEDEAVVAEVLRLTKGALELVDLSTHLPELRHRNGLRTWIVQDDNREYGSYAEAEQHRRDIQRKLDIDPSFFPPKEGEDIPLEHCIRLLPHLNNSGGFFVALFRKLHPFDDVAVPTVQHRVEACSDGVKRRYHEDRDRRLGKEAREDRKVDSGKAVLSDRQFFKGIDPIISLENHRVTQEVTEFYGLEGTDLVANLISRNLNNDEPRKVYFISSALKRLVDEGYDQAVRITSLGQQVLTRAFQRTEGSQYRCVYRFAHEGLSLVLPHITKQRLFLKADQMKMLLTERKIKIPNPDNAESEFTVSDPDIISKLGELEQGGCVAVLEDEEAARLGLPLVSQAGAGLTTRMPIAVSGWLISPYTLNLMVAEEDKSNLLKRLEEAMEQSSSVNSCQIEPETESSEKSPKKPRID